MMYTRSVAAMGAQPGPAPGHSEPQVPSGNHHCVHAEARRPLGRSPAEGHWWKCRPLPAKHGPPLRDDVSSRAPH